ncbi:hypothetical protein EKO27_g5014 [Xylaria grammica]|uniref:protein S-acyltransferase n=1 Tax=Xylaria grammica TaxID=363999 RepID=A0A439D6R1_9PEZI|nr:hypothetical protein EKO27_g5014 [Xylaria grammica]
MLCEQAPCSDINHVAGYHETALQAAARFNAGKIAEKLIEAGADVNIVAGRPLLTALTSGNNKFARILLDNGAMINAPGKFGSNALGAASSFCELGVIELLIDRGADVMAAGEDGYTPLQYASHWGRTEVVKLLLDKGADPNIVNNNGSTPLFLASVDNRVDTVSLLLDKDADPRIVTRKGLTPWHGACSKHGSVDLVKLLLNKDADPMAVTNDGSTPLHWASKHGFVDVVKLLLDKEVEVKADNDGWTPLHWASCNNHVDMVKLLLEKVDHASVADCTGRSPLFYAIMKGRTEVFDVLRAKQQPNITDYFGISALSIAARRGPGADSGPTPCYTGY